MIDKDQAPMTRQICQSGKSRLATVNLGPRGKRRFAFFLFCVLGNVAVGLTSESASAQGVSPHGQSSLPSNGTSKAASPALSANSLPQGGSVVAGQVSIGASNGSSLTITEGTQRAVVNWNTFSVGQQQSIVFIQPNGAAAILNRVTGNTPSTIAGQITGNGQVFLVNPNGIAITPTGSVSLQSGFVASTLGISNSDFQADDLHFQGITGSVSNAGTISVGRNGFVGLLGGQVSNSGLISLPAGSVALGAGSAIALDINGSGFLQILTPVQHGIAQASVSGQIQSSGGQIVIRAADLKSAIHNVVNISGSLSASSVHENGGTIFLDSGLGGTNISGQLDASSQTAQGGVLSIGGKTIALNGATLKTGGGSAGGNIRIGGGPRGASLAGLTTASRVSIDSDTHIDASASAGDGGDVTVWANQQTMFSGLITAAATGASGHGGAAEVSGGVLDYLGHVNLLAAHGNTGTLLLDPYDLTISTAADTNQSGFTATGTGSNINTTTLQSALAMANVTVATGNSGSEAGNITVSSPVTWSSNSTLALNAAGVIAINANITANSGGLSLTGTNISGSGNIATGNPGLTFTPSGSGTLSGIISGSGGLTKSGLGSLTLTGSNTYTGVTTAAAGTLTLNPSVSNSIGAINVTGGSGGANLVIAGPTTLSGNLTVGANAADTNSTVQISGNLTTPNFNIGNASGAVGTVTQTAGIVTVTSAQDPSFAVGSANGGTGTYNLSGGTISVFNGNMDLGRNTSTGTFNQTGGVVNTGNYTIIGRSLGATGVYNLSAGQFNQTGTGVGLYVGEQGTGILNVSGTGVVTASGFLGISGGAGIQGVGTVNLNGGEILTTYVQKNSGSSATFNFNGGLLQASGNSATFMTGLTTATVQSGGAFISDGGYAITIGQALAGSGGLTKSGTGTLTLSGSNSYTGNTTINAGTLKAGATSAFGSNSAVSISSGTTLDLAGFSNSIGSLSGAGTVTDSSVTPATLTTGGANASTNFSGVIHNGSGTLSLTQNGTGAFTLSGLNTYTGATTVSAGTLQVSGSGTLGTSASYAGNILISAGANFEYSSSANQTLSGTISGSGGLTKDTNTSTLTLTGNNTYTGVTTAAAGTLTLNPSVSNSIGAVNVTGGSGGANLVIAGRTTLSGNLTVGANAADTNSTVQISGNLTTPNFNIGNANGAVGTVTQTAGTVNVTSGVDPAFAVGSANGGTGTYNLSGGTIYVPNGSMDLGRNTSTGTFNQTGGIVNSVNFTIIGRSVGATGVYNLSAGQLNQTGTGAGLYVGEQGTGTLNVSGTGVVTASGFFGISGGAGTQGVGTVNLNGGEILTTYVQKNSGSSATFNFNGGLLQASGNSATFMTGLTTATVQSGGAFISDGGYAITIGQALTGSGGLTKSGAGTLTLSGANSYTGSTTINAGTLQAGATSAFGSNSAVSISSGTTLDLAGFSNGIGSLSGAGTVTNSSVNPATLTTGGANTSTNFSGVIQDGSGTLSLTQNGTGALTLSGLNTYTGATTVAAGTLQVGGSGTLGTSASYAGNILISAGANFEYSSSANQTLSGTISGSGGLTKDTNTSTLTLTGNNTYTGVTTVNSGTVAINGAWNVGVGTAAVTLASSATLTGTGTITAGTLQLSGPGTYSLTGSNAVDSLNTVGTVGDLSLNDTVDLTVNSASSSGNVNLFTSGNLTIAANGSVSGISPVLSTDAAFINQSGAAAVTATSGRWLIYSNAPGGDTFSNLNSNDTALWNATRLSLSPSNVTASGNRYLFAFNPALTLNPTNDTKVYGTTATSTVASDYVVTGYQPAVAGAYLGDSASSVLSGSPLVTSSGSVGTATVSGSPYAIVASLGTLSASNGYSLSLGGNSASLTVTARPITITADPQSQTYGNPVPTLTYAVGGLGLVNGDNLSGLLATMASATANVGAYAIAQGTLAASSNYAVNYISNNVSINARPITITADPQTQIYGNSVPTLTYSVGGSGLVNASTLSGTLATAASPSANVGTYAITQGTLGNSNYAVNYIGNNLTVNARPITVTADPQTQIYGNPVPTLTYSVGGLGLVNGYTLSGTLATAASPSANVGQYAITQGTLGNSNYAVNYTGNNLTVTARPITITADPESQVYGGAVPTLSYIVGGLGLVNGDSLSGSLATTATPASGIGIYPITQGSLSASSNYLVIGYIGSNITIRSTPQGLALNPASVAAENAVVTQSAIDSVADSVIVVGNEKGGNCGGRTGTYRKDCKSSSSTRPRGTFRKAATSN